MNVLVGLLAFTVGLGLFVFPRGVTAGVSDLVEGDAGHWKTVVVRAIGILGMVVGFALLVV